MKYVYEFIGTFFLVFTIGMMVLNIGNIGVFAPIAIGAVLASFVYAGGHISGGHYNPAISLAVFARGNLSLQNLILYWVAQIIAGLVAAYLTLFFKGELSVNQIALDPVKAFIAEFLFTFALCYVVLNTATAIATKGNSFFGLAIGFIVLAGAYSVGTISGAAFNPAVALAITVWKITNWENFWIFLAANFAGGIVAALVFKLAHPHES